MRLPHALLAGAALLGGGLGVACHANAPAAVADPGDLVVLEEVMSAPPVDAVGEHETVLDYLLARYDGDGDGRIAPAEYDRDETAWARLDRNRDGMVDDADFARGAGGMSEADIRAYMAQSLVARYFHSDDDADRLERLEVQEASAAYDEDGDAKISAEEFRALADIQAERGAALDRNVSRRLGESEPWTALVAGVDTDGDGAVTIDELVAFFDAQDDGDGVWNLNRAAASSRGGGKLQGKPAPDFTLEPLHGGDPVALSSFAGSKPVALIFGSYT